MKIFLLSFFPSFFFLFYESFIKNDRMLPTHLILSRRPSPSFSPVPDSCALAPSRSTVFHESHVRNDQPGRLSSLPSFQLPARTLEKIEETYQGKSKSLNQRLRSERCSGVEVDYPRGSTDYHCSSRLFVLPSLRRKEKDKGRNFPPRPPIPINSLKNLIPLIRRMTRQRAKCRGSLANLRRRISLRKFSNILPRDLSKTGRYLSGYWIFDKREKRREMNGER